MAVNDIQGVVLAGGRSSRFGSDKAEAVYRGKTMLSTAIKLIRELGAIGLVGGDVMVSCGQKSMSLPGVTSVPDSRPNCGPLGGIESAIMASTADRLLFLTCDMPLVTSDMLVRQIKKVDEFPDTQAVAWKSRSGRISPFPLLISRSVITLLSDYIDTFEPQELTCHSTENIEKPNRHIKKLSIKNFLNTLSTTFIPIDSKALFANVNTVDDLRSISG
nr:molybdenum cofactor guanylyltransferase [uncultured bacterium]